MNIYYGHVNAVLVVLDSCDAFECLMLGCAHYSFGHFLICKLGRQLPQILFYTITWAVDMAAIKCWCLNIGFLDQDQGF